MVGAKALRGDEEVRPLHDALREELFEGRTDFGLVTVRRGTVYEPVARAHRGFDGRPYLAGLGLPSADAQNRHPGTRGQCHVVGPVHGVAVRDTVQSSKAKAQPILRVTRA